MPLTRKQAWRRVRVRHEGEMKDDIGARCKRQAAEMAHPARQSQQGDQGQTRRPAAERSHQRPVTQPHRKKGGILSEKGVLDKWRLPKEGRDPSARPGVSAARRQAAAVCVRVGSRVSFNTVVAAILIPSAKDLHEAARRELWWQETDYRDFRINFIQFMRTPAVADVPELVPVDIVAESSGAAAVEQKEQEMDDDLQPVVMDAVAYNNDTADPQSTQSEPCVRAWAVEEPEGDVAAVPSACGDPFPETGIEREGKLSAETTPDPVVDTPLVAPPPGTTNGAAAVADAVIPSGASASSDDDGAELTDGGGCWYDQESNRRVEPCLTDRGDDGDDDIRVRRSFSNLETARRGGARLDSDVTSDTASDSDDMGDEAVAAGRPRALSLDGWFTCGLENGAIIKSYETHDHAGRLRDIVKLPPFPTACMTPPSAKTPELAKSNGGMDLTEALRRLRVTFNVSVNNGGRGATSCGDSNSCSGDNGEGKCRAEDDDTEMAFAAATDTR